MNWPVPSGAVLSGPVATASLLDVDADAEALFHALDDARVWKHIPVPRPTSTNEMRGVLAGHASRAMVTWVVRLTRECGTARAGSVVGMTSYLNASPVNASLEIGATMYSPTVWGTALNPQVKLLLLEYAFDALGVGRCELKTDARNVRSQRAISRLGAECEGVLRRHMRRADGTVRDTVVFSIIAETWPEVREGLKARLGPTDHARPSSTT
jgi:RimJ/RimL family protein N-acetyltransferase